MQKILYFLFYIYIRDLIKGATIPCSSEQTTKFAHVEIATKTVVCHDDPAEISTYTYNQNMTLDGQWHKILVGGTTDIFNCHVGCTGCYGSTENDCFTCSSLARGTKPLFPTYTEFTSVTPYSCPCRGNYTDDNTKDCKCPDGSYTKRSTTDDIISCEKCPNIYATCKYDNTTTSIIALTCATGTGRSTDASTNCTCTSGYTEVQNQVNCNVACVQPCATCVSGTGTTCTSCFDPNAVLINQQCNCKTIGFYLSQSGPNYTCIACHVSCLTCKGQYYNYCLSCIDSNMNLNNQICTCKQGYYLSASGNICYPCHATCQTRNGGNTNNCLTCDSLTQRTLQSGYCLCPQFFVTSLVPMCVRCDSSCLTCNDQNSCATCISGSNRYIQNPGDLCTCVPGYAENPSNPLYVLCHYSCLTCQDSYSICTSCPVGSNRQLLNNECLCQNKYFDDGGSSSCQPCDQSCLTCNGNNNDNCLTCDSTINRVLNNQRQCVCQQGYGYIDLNTQLYQICNNFCQTCDQINNCLTCDISLHRILQDPGTCPQDHGYYQAGSLCAKYDSTCKQCFGTDQNTCINCDLDAGRVLVGNQCQCTQGYFNNYNNECKQCYYACVSCVNKFYNGCIKCDPSRTLTNSQCICPVTR